MCVCVREREQQRENVSVCVRESTHTPETNVQSPQGDTHQHDRASVDAEHDDGSDVHHNVSKVEEPYTRGHTHTHREGERKRCLAYIRS